MSELAILFRRVVRDFDLLHGSGAARREIAISLVIFSGAAFILYGVALIGEGA